MHNKYLNSKWTSVKKVKGWRHYQVRNVFKNKKELEIFAVCDKNIFFNVTFNEIRNENLWLPGWKEMDKLYEN